MFIDDVFFPSPFVYKFQGALVDAQRLLKVSARDSVASEKWKYSETEVVSTGQSGRCGLDRDQGQKLGGYI